MIIAVYAPHDPRDKRMLWDYLAHVINQWQGEVVIMGDFNEVRVKSDRFGTNFNVLGANIFNSFINSTGLEEVHLGGSAFTWCHKSATKMSKLDRFFVSNNLLNIFPPLAGYTLDRFLSRSQDRFFIREDRPMIMVRFPSDSFTIGFISRALMISSLQLDSALCDSDGMVLTWASVN
ncbi:RNA-directed DNA polymerase, eukaryota [Tanacetum coccineum]